MIDNDKINLCKLGERFCVTYLIKHNYNIIECNYFSAYGEIDIIAKKEKTIVFTEVKTRNIQKNSFEKTLNSVSVKKRERIKKTAELFLSEHIEFYDYFVRFDIFALLYNKNTKRFSVKHLKDAFA